MSVEAQRHVARAADLGLWLAKLRSAAPLLLFGSRLWISICLARYVAFWLELDNPHCAGTSAAIVCQPQLGVSLRKGWFRITGTLIRAANYVPLLAPQNEMSYDTAHFHNQSLGTIVGCSAAAIAFRLLPPLSAAFRARRLLALSLRDLRRLSAGRMRSNWWGRMRNRLVALPDAATPLQRALLLAALSAGNEIIRLRPLAHRLGLDASLEGALAALARRDSATGVAGFRRFDEELAARDAAQPAGQRGRSGVLALAELLTQHAAYLDAGSIE